MGDTILEADDKPLEKLTDEKDIIERALEQAELALEAVKDNHDSAREDLRFAFAEDQWDADIKEQRKGRPCLTINKLPANADKVEGELRQNKISIKAIPWNGPASSTMAKVRAGVIRNIEEISDAEYHYVTAGVNAANGGKGVLRAYTRYVDDDTFDQELRVMAVDNPLSVVFDENAKAEGKTDANYAFIFDKISRKEHNRRWPDKTPADFTTDMPSNQRAWASEDDVTIAEYFLKVPIKRTLYQIETEAGMDVVDKLPEGVEAIRKREVESYKIEWRLIDGKNTLEGPTEWAGKQYIPLVEIPGKKVNIDGEVKQRGMFRYAKDSQKMYNYWASTDCEVGALAPKVPWLITGEMVKGYEDIWKNAHLTNYPYLPYNIDTKNPQATPTRNNPGAQAVGMIQQRQLAGDEIKDTIGRHEAGLGMRSNETSGVAIEKRAARGDLGDFAYPDNLARGVKHLGRILMDAMPSVYDTERLIRLVHEDDREEFVVLNKAMPDGILNDMSVGRYEVKITVGKHYNSRQAEAMESMTQFTQYNPQAGAQIADLIAESSNWPGKEKIAKRLRKAMGIDEDENNQKAQQERLAAEQEKIKQAVQAALEQYKQGPEAKKAESEAQEAEQKALEAKYQAELKKTELARAKGEFAGLIQKQ